MARTAEPPGWTSQFRELVLDLAADLHDLRDEAATLSLALDSDKYDEAQALAGSLRAGGSDGLIYFSRRDHGGQCVGLFYSDRAANLIEVRHIDYHWAAGDGMVSVTRPNGTVHRAPRTAGRVWRD